MTPFGTIAFPSSLLLGVRDLGGDGLLCTLWGGRNVAAWPFVRSLTFTFALSNLEQKYLMGGWEYPKRRRRCAS